MEKKFRTIQEVKQELILLGDESEAFKYCSTILAPAEAYCNYYKDTLRDQILAEQSNIAADQLRAIGVKIVEKTLDRMARNSTEYKEAGKLYSQALELKIFLKTYIAGLKIHHEKTVADIHNETAQIKANLYHKGS